MIKHLSLLAQQAIMTQDAETAHGLGLKALRFMPTPFTCKDDTRLSVEAFGLSFCNPLGLAAGMDKNAYAPDKFLKLGFGLVEIGTLTPKPQAGNPKPRMFRLPEDLSVINRLGFNNDGFAPALKRLAHLKGQIGVNVGANKDSEDRAADYVLGIKTFAGLAKYFTVNISSPNTPGLRDLQQGKALDDLLKRVMEEKARSCPNTPVLLKIAPDLHLTDLDDVVSVALANQIDGLIVSNTTITRPETLQSSNKLEQGGLSGKSLFDFSTRMLAETYARVEGKVPLVGVGGIHDAATAIAKIEAGATLIQLYSALVYKGLPLIDEVKQGVLAHLKAKNTTLKALTGSKNQDWWL